MLLLKDENEFLIGAVLNPEATLRKLDEPPQLEEPKRKKRKTNEQKHQEINEGKRAVQEALSPVFSTYHAWLSKHQSQSLLPPPPLTKVNHVHQTDWCALYTRRFELWPKLFVLPSQRGEALFGRLHSNPSADSNHVKAKVSFDSPALTDQDVFVSLPPDSKFLMSHGVQLDPLLQEIEVRNQRYSILVVDPPWENASVRRGGGGYESLPAGELCKLPLRELVDQECGCCFLWVTNRPRIHNFINEVLLERWGLRLVRTWYWIKTCDQGRPLIPLNCLHRHCYEPLLVLAPCSQQPSILSSIPQDGFAFFSKAREHSRKPLLRSLISELLPSHLHKERCDQQCELFARELQEHWTSWGNEVLKFQEIAI